MVEQLVAEPHGLEHRRTAQAQVLVHYRRVEDDEVLGAARRAVVIDQCDRLLHHALGQFDRIGNRGGRHDELRRRAVKVCDPLETAHDVGHMRAKNAAQRMQLVDDHEA